MPHPWGFSLDVLKMIPYPNLCFLRMRRIKLSIETDFAPTIICLRLGWRITKIKIITISLTTGCLNYWMVYTLCISTENDINDQIFCNPQFYFNLIHSKKLLSYSLFFCLENRSQHDPIQDDISRTKISKECIIFLLASIEEKWEMFTKSFRLIHAW